jgi:tetratricopeptide (TPR) repeat protein
MNKYFSIFIVSICFFVSPWSLLSQANQDYFKVHAGALPVKIFVGSAAKAGSLLGVDGQKGIIYAQMEGAGRMQLELRGLEKQNIRGFSFVWPQDAMKTLQMYSNEQYSKELLPALRPVMYKVLLFLDIPQQYFAIHDNCLIYVKALIAMEQYNEAFYLLSRLNLNKLDSYGYRDFSEASLDLASKMIRANAKSAKIARALLQKVTIRNNSADHASYLKLADSLRTKGLYNEAISEYARLGPIVQKSPGSPYAKIVEIWPIYCYIKLYETYAKAALKDARYKGPAGKIFNTAMQSVKKLDEKPPARQTNEYSLYKLIRALLRVQYARQYEQGGNELKAAEFYRQSVLEVTEGIVSARVGLDWLPESLLMAGDAYEKLNLNEAAMNVYKQVSIFYEGSKWAVESKKRLDALPAS